MGWVTRLGGWGLLMAGALAAGTFAAASPEMSPQTDQTSESDKSNQINKAAPGKQKQPVPWSSTCSAAARNLPLECALEQRAFMRQSGQLIAMFPISASACTQKPL